MKRAGDPPDGFYIVIEGQIEWTSRVGKQDVYVMTLADGEFWDHELLLTDKPYPVSALWELLLWIREGLTTRELLDKLEVAIQRISELVEAVKQYSYMDRAPLQEIDVHDGLENTLIMLSHQLKCTENVLIREYGEGLPLVNAYGSGLNQVWTNLIDNAIDAVDGSGRIWIRTSWEPGRLLAVTPASRFACPYRPVQENAGESDADSSMM